GVALDAGHAGDGPRLPGGDEHRGDQVARQDVGLGHGVAQRPRRAQPARTGDGADGARHGHGLTSPRSAPTGQTTAPAFETASAASTAAATPSTSARRATTAPAPSRASADSVTSPIATGRVRRRGAAPNARTAEGLANTVT